MSAKNIINKHAIRWDQLRVLKLAIILVIGVFPCTSWATVITYTYDDNCLESTNSIGRLCSVNDDSGITDFYYDQLGRNVRTVKIIDGNIFNTQTGYDPDDRVTSVGYPDGSIVSYEYTGTRLHRVYEGGTWYAIYQGYNSLGQATQVNYNNDTSISLEYAKSNNTLCPYNSFRLCRIFSYRRSGGPALQHIVHNYKNTAGEITSNITGISDLYYGDQSFGYDDLNRLTSATGPYGSLSYAYDEIGNMTNNSRNGDYEYLDPAHVHAVTSVGGYDYSYDANGNLITKTGMAQTARTMAYDEENRLISIYEDGLYILNRYDGDGGLIKKSVNGSTKFYIGKLYECDAPCWTGSFWTGDKYIYAGSTLIAIRTAHTGEMRYIHADHLGSTNLVTDATGAVIQNISYFPYGKTHTEIYETGERVNRRYTGQEIDDSTGLYFYNARYYDPSLGRFIQADTIVPNPRNPQSFNRYAYTYNNPINYTDPSGHCPVCIIAVASAIGAIAAGMQSDWDPQAMLMGAAVGAFSAGAGLGVTALGGGSILAGMASSTSGALISQGWGADVDVIQAAITGGVSGFVGGSFGSNHPYLGAAAAGATAAMITDGNPAQAALIAVGSAIINSSLQNQPSHTAEVIENSDGPTTTPIGTKIQGKGRGDYKGQNMGQHDWVAEKIGETEYAEIYKITTYDGRNPSSGTIFYGGNSLDVKGEYTIRNQGNVFHEPSTTNIGSYQYYRGVLPQSVIVVPYGTPYVHFFESVRPGLPTGPNGGPVMEFKLH